MRSYFSGNLVEDELPPSMFTTTSEGALLQRGTGLRMTINLERGNESLLNVDEFFFGTLPECILGRGGQLQLPLWPIPGDSGRFRKFTESIQIPR